MPLTAIPRTVCLSLLLAPGVVHSQVSLEQCRVEYNAAMKRCLGRVNDISAVAALIRKCRNLHDDKYQMCVTQASSGDARECNRDEAKINIDWVLFKDAGARATYNSFLQRGESSVDAVLSAQGHNPHAQQTIRNCRAWAKSYIGSKGFLPLPSPERRQTSEQRNGIPVGKDPGRQAEAPELPPIGEYKKYWDFNCSVTWWTTLRTGGIAPGLCEEDETCKPLLQYWRQTHDHQTYRWTEIASTDPEGIGVEIEGLAQENALNNARQELKEARFNPTAARVASDGWNWELIDPRSGQYDSGETFQCKNLGLKEWRTK